MRLARSWKWSLVLIGGILYILSTSRDNISERFLSNASTTNRSAENNSMGSKPEKTSAMSSQSNLTENKYLEQEMAEFITENHERKEVIRLVWCRTPKVATTTWARIVLQLYGVKKFAHYHSQMKNMEKKFLSRNTKKKYVSSLANKLRKYIGFVIGRHPMARLYSAFRDKILRRSIIVNNVNGKGVTPSFNKFLTFIAMNNPSSFNRHWKPNWVLCNPCLYNYDFILKMETFDRDSGALLRKIGAGELAEVNHLNQRGKIKRSDPNYQALLKNVKPHILERVLNIYYLDFVMFGYDMKPFQEILSRKKDEANKTS